MSMRHGWLLMFAVLGLCSGAGTAAQSGPAAAPAADRVTLDVMVEAKGSGPVAGLEQQDFTLLDNKVSRPIRSFAARSGPDAPAEVVLVLDAVNTRYETVAFAREQIKKFLLMSGGELALPTSLAISTDRGVEIGEAPSRDGKALDAALEKANVGLRSVTQSQGVYGAEERVDLSLKALDQLTSREAAKPGRKVMVWISPGWPLLSGPHIQLSNQTQEHLYQRIVSISTELRKARVTLYNVDPLGSSESIFRTTFYKEFVKGVSRPSQVDVGDLSLEVLATQTGGLVLQSDNDLAGLLKRAVDDTKAFYEISFDAAPAEQAVEYHAIEVKIAKPGLTARTRAGYYSQP